MKKLITELTALAEKYSIALESQIAIRVKEMEQDNKSHYLIYQVLGISDSEGDKIDIYQNKGRFLYKYAGSFLEEAAILCFQYKFKDAKSKVKIPNLHGQKPKAFEIDCLIAESAYEIKWRDATTDGDHITKEHTRIKSIQKTGYKPIRLMFYYPNRTQAIRIQQTLATVYSGVGGEYYFGQGAWDHLKEMTGVDLHKILTEIASERVKNGKK